MAGRKKFINLAASGLNTHYKVFLNYWPPCAFVIKKGSEIL